MLGFIILGIIIVTFTHWWIISPYEYWKKKKVPFPKPTYFVGNMGSTVTGKKSLAQLYQDIYNEYSDCKYIGYYKFRRPGIILRDMNLVKDVLVKEFSRFHDNDIHVDEKIDPLFGNNPFCLKGEKWKVIRTLITSSITHAKVRAMFKLINHVGDSMMKYMNENSQITGEEGVNAKNLAEMFTSDAVANCAFGLEARSFEDPNAEFKCIGQLFSDPTPLTALKHFITFVLPPLASIFKVKFLPLKLEEYFNKIVLGTIKYREEKNIVRNDYLDLLIKLKSKPIKYGFDDTNVVAQALTFWIDGFETSSIAISFALYELAINPGIQQKLRCEIISVLEKHDGEISYDIIQEIQYLDMFVSETLRMHSPIFMMSRLCTNRYEFPPSRKTDRRSVIIEPETPVIIPVKAIHYDPNIYPNPEKFDPERFTEENKNSRPKYSYLAFGEGPRICLGFKFGLTQTKVALVHILQQFYVSLNKKTKQPLELDPRIFLTTPIGGIWLNFTKLE